MNKLLKTIVAGLMSTTVFALSNTGVQAYNNSATVSKFINRHHLKNNSEVYVDLGETLNVRSIEVEMHDHDENYKFDLFIKERNGNEYKIVQTGDISTNNNGDDICEFTKNDFGDHAAQGTDYCYDTKVIDINREIYAMRFFIYGDAQDDGNAHIKNMRINLNRVLGDQTNDFCARDAKYPQVFPDVPMNSPYYEHVQELECHNVIHGYSDNTFRPYSLVTRGEMAKIISNGMRMEENKFCGSFTDVPTSNKFYNYVSTLKCRGVIGGFSDGTFRPDSYVTRAEAMKFIVNGARIRTNNSNFLATGNTTSMFSDINYYNPLHQYVIAGQNVNAYQDVYSNQFRPNNFITRAELALYLNLVRREID